MSTLNSSTGPALRITIICVTMLFSMLARAQLESSCESAFDGRQIRFIAPAAAGGGWDRSARALAAEFEKHSDAQTYVLNVTGGTGYLATRTVLRGDDHLLTIGVLQEELIINPFGRDGLASLDAFHVLGLIAIDDQAWLVREDFKVEELNGDPAIVFALGDFEAAVQLQMAADMLEFPVARITGFPGSASAISALLRGDIDATSFSLSSVNRAIASNPLRPYIILSNRANPEHPDVPYFSGAGSLIDSATAELNGESRLAIMERADDIVLLSQTFRSVVMSMRVDEQTRLCVQYFIEQSLASTDLRDHMAAVRQNFTPLAAGEALERLQTKQRLIERYSNEITPVERN